MLFIILLMVWSKKVNIVVIWQKKHFRKELAITKHENEDFENCNNCWTCDSVYVDGNVKVRDYCHITGKYRDFAHRDCNIKVKLNHKIPIVFHNVKNYDSHRIMLKQGKFIFQINIVPKRLGKIYEL